MPNLTLSISEELQAILKKHSEVNWSEIARRAMWDYAQKLDIMEKLTQKSQLTEKDIKRLDHVIKDGIHERYLAAKKK